MGAGLSSQRRMCGRPLALSEAQANYLTRAFKIRARLTNQALAQRLNIRRETVGNYAHRKQKKLVLGQYPSKES